MNAKAQEIATRDETQVVAADAGTIMAVISRAAADPAVNVEKLERLTALYERIKANEAKATYMAALSDMQPVLPVVERRGRITITDRTDRQKVIQSTPYALWDDINEALKPILHQHGFTLSFRTGVAADGRLTVTGVLGHRAGHQEETTMTLAHDSSGSKNSVQAVGSSVSYGKRYTATALLNLTFRDEDDDGKTGADPEKITDEQLKHLRAVVTEVGANEASFVKYLGIEKLADLAASEYANAIAALGKKQKAARS
jgi:hypothetical protein